jgi:prepilin-type N-terminal cleavage/methylation domain-containing protein
MLKISDRDQRGFTMTELMVVVGIIAALVAIAAVGISGSLRQSRLREATRELDGEIASIRNAARTQQQRVVAQITGGNRLVAFYDINNNGVYDVGGDYFDTNNNGVYDAGTDVDGTFHGHTYPNGIQFTVTSIPGAGAVAPLTTIRFNETGNIVDANRVITVTLDSEPLRRYRIWVFTTGSTRVERSEDAGMTWPTRPW